VPSVSVLAERAACDAEARRASPSADEICIVCGLKFAFRQKWTPKLRDCQVLLRALPLRESRLTDVADSATPAVLNALRRR
jgi:hypothetical protein